MKLLLVLLLLLSSALPALAERRALVLGNGAYPANALPNPTNDARDVAQRLRQMGFLVDEGIDLSRTEAMQLVQTFAASLGRDDIALFYYAGHASQIGSDNYLMPVDADLSGEDALKSSSIRMQSILSSIGERSNTRIIILDACRTNPFVNASASRAGGVRSGLGKMEGGIGSFIAFSTGPNNVAADGRGRNSPFTAALLRHMATPGADIHAIMRNVRAEVRRDTDDQQIPWENSSLIEELYLSAALQPQVQAPAQPFGAAPAEQPVPPVPPHSGFSAHPEAAAIPPVAQPQAEPQAAVYTGAGAFGAPGEPYEDYGYDDTMEMPQAYAPPVGNAWSLTKTASVLGAVGSLALVIGIGVWGYQLVMRDVSGLPVVRSVEGPMRVQPENPGGSQADHQGLAVNSVAATGAAEAPADRLTLAPQPIELTPDDQPLSRLQTPSQDLPPTVVSGEQTRQQADSSPVSEASMESFQNGDIDALVAELTDGVVPMGEIQPVAVSAPTALNSTTSTVSPAIVQPEPLQPVAAVADRPSAEALALIKAPGVKLSLRPNLRPARFSPASAAPAQLTGRATEELDPNSLPAGTRLAQLGAYESAEVARAEWDRIYASFGDYLEGKKRVIQRAESGGRTFYRLRAVGFEGLSDARRFCSALVARNADCIPVTTR